MSILSGAVRRYRAFSHQFEKTMKFQWQGSELHKSFDTKATLEQNYQCKTGGFETFMEEWGSDRFVKLKTKSLALPLLQQQLQNISITEIRTE
jgi:hypothetical protein